MCIGINAAAKAKQGHETSAEATMPEGDACGPFGDRSISTLSSSRSSNCVPFDLCAMRSLCAYPEKRLFDLGDRALGETAKSISHGRDGGSDGTRTRGLRRDRPCISQASSTTIPTFAWPERAQSREIVGTGISPISAPCSLALTWSRYGAILDGALR